MRATSPTTRLALRAGAWAQPPCTTTSYSPAQVPLNLSPFTQITLHTRSQTQSTRASRRSRWRPGWDRRAQLCGRRTEDVKQSSANVLKRSVLVSLAPKVETVCAAARAPGTLLARSAWIQRVRAVRASSDACSCARASPPRSPAPPPPPWRDPCAPLRPVSEA